MNSKLLTFSVEVLTTVYCIAFCSFKVMCFLTLFKYQKVVLQEISVFVVRLHNVLKLSGNSGVDISAAK